MATITINSKKFKRFMERYGANLKRSIPKALNRSGEKTREIILMRTERGVGLRGAFKKYSPGYREYRNSQGRGTKPDLNFSGRMLSNLDVERKSNNIIIVGFKRKEERVKAEKNQKTRPFIGVTSSEQSQVVKSFVRQLEKDLR
jgi:hypothetical protein